MGLGQSGGGDNRSRTEWRGRVGEEDDEGMARIKSKWDSGESTNPKVTPSLTYLMALERARAAAMANRIIILTSL